MPAAGSTALYGLDTGIKYDKLFGLSKLVEKLSGHKVPSNRPVVGDSLFHVESGIIASWWMNCGHDKPTELFPYTWDVVGQPAPKIVVGKGSGIDTIKARLRALNVTATEEEAMKVVMAVKEYSMSTKDLLTDEEFNKVLKATLPVAAASVK